MTRSYQVFKENEILLYLDIPEINNIRSNELNFFGPKLVLKTFFQKLKLSLL